MPPSPVTSDFTYTPSQPTDATPVTFTGSGDGTPPYTFTWDLGGQAASGQTVTRTFPPGTYTITLTVTDGAGMTGTNSQLIAVGHSVLIASVKQLSNPFRLAIAGSGFQARCAAAVGGTPAPATKYVKDTKVLAKGAGLKAMVPRGIPVEVTVTNSNGAASAPYSFTR